MSLCCHGNLCFERVIENVIKYDLYAKFPRIFAHNVQMCAKFCCKNFNDVAKYLEYYTIILKGGRFFVDTLYKNCQRQSCCAIYCLSSGINILAGGSSVPFTSERKGTDPHWKHPRCTHFTS